MTAIPRFEELDYQKTAMGDLILRKRTVLSLGNEEIYEIILGEAFLMSSLFTVVEEELARLGLAAAREAFPDQALRVIVGGLGLGHTARAALEFDEVRSLGIVEYLKPVIEWHQKEWVPLGRVLNEDPRCTYLHGDFFKMSLEDGYHGANERYHAVLLDIDHSPAHLLADQHAEFYAPTGLEAFSRRIEAGGVFGLWSDDPPEQEFLSALDAVFESVESHEIAFHNPIQERDFQSTVYLARKAR